MPGSGTSPEELSQLHQVYQQYQESPSEALLADFMDLVKEEARKVLLTMENAREVNVDDVAEEYAVYLTSRLWAGNLPEIKSWYSYIYYNIRWILHHNSQELYPVEQLVDFILHDKEDHPKHDFLFKDSFVTLVKFFYTEKEIQRLAPLAASLLRSRGRWVLEDKLPEDVGRFIRICLVAARRLITEEAEEIDIDPEAIPPVLFKSSFILAGLTSKYRELCLALPYPYLVQLSILAGGKKLKIPTLRELDTLVTASECLWRKVSGEDEDPRYRAKEELDYDHDVRSLDLVMKEVTLDLYRQPVAKFLFTLLQSMDEVLENLSKVDLAKLSPHQVLQLYEMLSKSMESTNQLMQKLIDLV